MSIMEEEIRKAADILLKSKSSMAFTGAGISVESGIPPFRGEGGLWTKYDPGFLDLDFYISNPNTAWPVIKEIFYDFFGKARPNMAHLGLALLERKGLLKGVVTQNIDNLHQEAGSKNVIEFHGNCRYMVCLDCQSNFNVSDITLNELPPSCPACDSLLKPDFIFFGEAIPPDAYMASQELARNSQAVLIIGSTGVITPANQIPIIAKHHGAVIIEINTEPSTYTNYITDIYLQGKASEIMKKLLETMF